MTAPVPVLVITGPVRVGKSTIANEAAWLLRQADVPTRWPTSTGSSSAGPSPPTTPWNERVNHRDLACMWANFRQGGADRLILVRVLETRSLLERATEAVPSAQITVVQLWATPCGAARAHPVPGSSDPDWFLDATRHTAEVFEQAQVEDHLTTASTTTSMTAPAGLGRSRLRTRAAC